MSTYLLNISSDDGQTNDTTDDFTINFSPPLTIHGNWAMALQSMSMWYSYYNISSDYDNQIFRYFNGSAWQNIIITPGLYSIDDLNAFLQASMLANGDTGTDSSGNPIFYISLTPNYNTFKLLITLSNSFEVDFTVGNLYQILGFPQSVITTTQYGINNVNITNGVNRIMVHIDCVVGSYASSMASDIIYSFSADGAPSSLLEINPARLIWLPINKSGYLYHIRITITDQQSRRVNLNGEEVSLALYLKRLN